MDSMHFLPKPSWVTVYVIHDVNSQIIFANCEWIVAALNCNLCCWNR